MTKDKTRQEMEAHIDFLETRLKELKKLPFIRINPKDESQQKATPASKQYKELLQQYINLVKAYKFFTDKGNSKQESDFPDAFKNFIEGDDL